MLQWTGISTSRIPAQNGIIPEPFWKLTRAVYGLNDAPALWFDEFCKRLRAKGWVQSFVDPCLWVYPTGPIPKLKDLDPEDLAAIPNKAMMILHVDDVLASGEGVEAMLKDIAVEWKGIDPVDVFLGTEFIESKTELKLTQEKYIQGLNINMPHLDEYRLKRLATAGPLPLDAHFLHHVPENEGISSEKQDTEFEEEMSEKDKERPCTLSEHKEFRGNVGKLNWLSGNTRPDLQFCVALLSSWFQEPIYKVLVWSRRALQYALITAHRGITFSKKHKPCGLVGICDSSWARKDNGYRSTLGYIVCVEYEGTDLLTHIAWKSSVIKKICESSSSAEFVAAHAVASKLVEIRSMLKHVGIVLDKLTLKTDSNNLLDWLQRKKRCKVTEWGVGIKVQALKQLIETTNITLTFVASLRNIADEFTKPKEVILLGSILDTKFKPVSRRFELATEEDQVGNCVFLSPGGTYTPAHHI